MAFLLFWKIALYILIEIDSGEMNASVFDRTQAFGTSNQMNKKKETKTKMKTKTKERKMFSVVVDWNEMKLS